MPDNNIPCIGGSIANLQVNNDDCDCVGIVSIVNNQPTQNSFTITLSNGQSLTLPLVNGATGPAGATGPTGPSGVDGETVLNNTYPYISPASVGSLVQIGEYIFVENQFSTDQDEATIHLGFTYTPIADGVCGFQLYLNDSLMVVSGFSTLTTFQFNSNVAAADVDIRISRVDNSTLNFTFEVTPKSSFVNSQPVHANKVLARIDQEIVSVTGLDLAASNTIFDIKAQSAGANDIVLTEFEIIFKKKAS